MYSSHQNLRSANVYPLQASEEDSEDSDDSDSGSEENSAPEAGSAGSADSDSSSSDESEDEAPPKKRKAETKATPVAKKAKKEESSTTEGDGVKNLFVGSLSWNVDEDWLTREFEGFGELSGVRVISDKATGRSKGSVPTFGPHFSVRALTLV